VNDFFNHLWTTDRLVDLVVALAAILLFRPLVQLLHFLVSFIPHRVSDEFKNVTKFAPILEKAKADAQASVAFIGAEIGMMIVSCWLSTLLAGCLYVVCTATPKWQPMLRGAVIAVLIVWFVGCVYHMVKRLLALRMLHLSVFPPQFGTPGIPTPPKPATAAPAPPTS